MTTAQISVVKTNIEENITGTRLLAS